MINSKDLTSIYQALVLQNSKSHDKATAIRLARAELLEIIKQGDSTENIDEKLDLENAETNVYLDSIFEEMNIVNGSNNIFGNIDFDEDKLLTDEELISFNQKDKDEQEEIMDNMNFIFESIDADGDGMVNQEELDTLNGGLAEDENANAIKKLMVMMGMNIEDSAKQAIQADIDLMLANQDLIEDMQESSSSDFKPSSSPKSSSTDGKGDTDSFKTPEEYSSEINKKEADKAKIKSQADADILKQENIINNAMLDSGVSEEVMNDYAVKKADYDTQIASQDALISQANLAIQDYTAQLGGISSTIAEYTKQIQNLTTTKLNGDTTDTQRNSRIDTKINNLNTAIAAEETKRATLQTQIETQKTNLEKANQEKLRLEGEQAGLLDTLIQQNEGKLSDETKAIIQTAREQIEQIKTKEKQDIEKIDAEILTLKTEKNKLERKAESDKVIDENKESNFDENGKRIGLRDWPETEEEYAMYGLKSQSAIKAFEKCEQRLKEAYIDLSDWCREQGIYIQVNSSYRSYEQQVALYDNGNNPKAAKPGSSLHEKGRAIDLRPYELDRTTRLRSDAVYEKMGRYWTDVLGYSWGGDWKNNTEEWHFEIRK